MSSYWSQDNAIVATIEAANAGATTTQTSDTIDMSKWGRVAFIVQSAEVAATSAAVLTVLSGSATGTITTTVGSVVIAANQDDKQWVYEVNDTKLTQGHRYVAATLAVTTATGYFDMIAIASLSRVGPASDGDLASVTISVA